MIIVRTHTIIGKAMCAPLRSNWPPAFADDSFKSSKLLFNIQSLRFIATAPLAGSLHSRIIPFRARNKPISIKVYSRDGAFYLNNTTADENRMGNLALLVVLPEILRFVEMGESLKDRT